MDPEEILLLRQWEKLGLLRKCNRQVRETTEKLALLSFADAYSTAYQDQSESEPVRSRLGGILRETSWRKDEQDPLWQT